MTLWLYGWASARTKASALGRGAAGERLTQIRLGAVVAVIGEVERPLRPSLARLKAQDRVVRRLWRRLPAFLPARFGSAVEDLQELRQLVIGRTRALARSVRRVLGGAQMTVRGLQPSRPAAASARKDTPGTRYLSALAQRTQVPELTSMRAEYAGFVRDERVERRAGPQVYWLAHHLVPVPQIAAYRGAIRRAASARGLGVLITGPQAPYAFGDE